ncbi:FKBP-type peptidyl-prolyl cis-trans isomerase [Mucilaginibacter sp. KACC 22063]|uniref:FKBP-type peptidyl-prolyl cis-trans isomerase n=1 Tax=Mucilaginibacter sp. KACC 22063 TaxID=3025666 RepID=UPI0023650FD2|nr:FKBP-type peptidyl-prolyl cis-trans isomerase [Mucilaginibacter sp. KACC 22063]WDF54635.1 FKBP-type peptidyl-prolyl cis-trans isomerase [Mucilaginibacter sp. KACC 22063]
MKRTLTTLLALCTVGLISVGMLSCRKDQTEPNIKQYDDEQIQNYIKANNLTGYVRDQGDTTGIYYKILRAGTGKALSYTDKIFYVYTQSSLDGKFTQTDTFTYRGNNFVGEMTPSGIQLAIVNMLKNYGTQAHVLIPSHLAYGTSGSGTGSTRLPGNESIDYYINMITPDNQAAYDDVSIQQYMKANGLSGYTKTSSGLYYKVTKQGTGTVKLQPGGVIGVQFTGKLFNGTMFDDFNSATDTIASVRDYSKILKGWREGFQYVTAGAKLSLIIPSGLAYGVDYTKEPASYYGFNDGVTPGPNSCLYYDFNIVSVNNTTN